MKFLKLIFAAVIILPLMSGCIGCEPEEPKVEIKNIIYNDLLINQELSYLEGSNYPEEAEEREEVLLESQKIMKEYNMGHIFITVIPPPVPCPPSPRMKHCFPGEDLMLPDLLLGVFSNSPAESGMNIVDSATEKLVGKGVFVEFDEVFSTAWFRFEAVNGELLGNELLLQVNTLIKDGEDFSAVSVEDKIPANTFKTDQ